MEHARFYSNDMPRAAAISMTIGKLHPGNTIPEHKAHEHPEIGTGNPVYVNQRQERPFCQSPHKRKTTTASPKRQWPSNHSASPTGCRQKRIRSSAYSKGLIHGAPCSLSRATGQAARTVAAIPVKQKIEQQRAQHATLTDPNCLTMDRTGNHLELLSRSASTDHNWPATLASASLTRTASRQATSNALRKSTKAQNASC